MVLIPLSICVSVLAFCSSTGRLSHLHYCIRLSEKKLGFPIVTAAVAVNHSALRPLHIKSMKTILDILNICQVVAGVGVSIFSLYYAYTTYKKCQKDYDDWYDNLVKTLKIDKLRINRNLAFGIQTFSCSKHVSGSIFCQDLQCKYGPLSFMIDKINKAKKSIDICVYIFTATVIEEAVIKAHKRFVKVRIITDWDMAFSSKSSINKFRLLGIPVRQRMSPYIMHHKFMILDDEFLMTGTMNYTMTGALCNWESVLAVSHPELVEPFVSEFQNLWEQFNTPI